jgi:hypothetical protein
VSTGWAITIGYNSDLSPLDRDKTWETLKNVAATIREDTAALFQEALAFDAPPDCGGEDLEDYCAIYTAPREEGGPLWIDEPGQAISIIASGGAPSRIQKEHVARAFCRLVLYAMHRQGIEINLHVA